MALNGEVSLGDDGPEAIKAARVRWRRRQIVDAATSLLARLGFQRMLITDIAKEAGMSVGTIYQYVESKEDILTLIVLDILESYRAEVPAAMEGIVDPVERLEAGFRAYCSIVDERRAATLLAYQEGKHVPTRGLEDLKNMELETNGYFSDCIREAVRQGRARCSEPDLMALNLTMLAHTWALKHWYLRSHFTLEQYISLELASVLRSILSEEYRDAYAHLVGVTGA